MKIHLNNPYSPVLSTDKVMVSDKSEAYKAHCREKERWNWNTEREIQEPGCLCAGWSTGAQGAGLAVFLVAIVVAWPSRPPTHVEDQSVKYLFYWRVSRVSEARVCFPGCCPWVGYVIVAQKRSGTRLQLTYLPVVVCVAWLPGVCENSLFLGNWIVQE